MVTSEMRTSGIEMEKIGKRRLQRYKYGHVIRVGGNSRGKIDMNIEVTPKQG